MEERLPVDGGAGERGGAPRPRPPRSLAPVPVPVVALYTQPRLKRPPSHPAAAAARGDREDLNGEVEEEEEASLPGFALAAGAASSPFASLPALCPPSERQLRAAAAAAAAANAAAEAAESIRKRKERGGGGEGGAAGRGARASPFLVPIVLTAADRREQQWRRQRRSRAPAALPPAVPFPEQQPPRLVDPRSPAFLLALKRALRAASAAADARAVAALLRLATLEHTNDALSSSSSSFSSPPNGFVAALLTSRVGAVVAGLEAVRKRRKRAFFCSSVPRFLISF